MWRGKRDKVDVNRHYEVTLAHVQRRVAQQVVWEAVFIFGAGMPISPSLSVMTFPIIFSAISRLVAPQ